jgi:hypothetical protein
MNTVPHTPKLPFQVMKGPNGLDIADADEFPVCIMIGEEHECQHTAHFMTNAVNEYASLKSRADAVEGLVEALENILARYVGLVESGDAGNWDAEKEPQVIAARAALSLVKVENSNSKFVHVAGSTEQVSPDLNAG